MMFQFRLIHWMANEPYINLNKNLKQLEKYTGGPSVSVDVFGCTFLLLLVLGTRAESSDSNESVD